MVVVVISLSRLVGFLVWSLQEEFGYYITSPISITFMSQDLSNSTLLIALDTRLNVQCSVVILPIEENGNLRWRFSLTPP